MWAERSDRPAKKPSCYLARWNEGKNFDPVILRFSEPAKPLGNSFQATVAASSAFAHIIESSTDLSTWNPVLTNASTPFPFIDSNAPPTSQRFYRARSAP
jgi:hypothetical protein